MKSIQLRADISIQAAAAGSTKQPRVRIRAYGGGLMSVPGVGVCAIDLAGLKTSDRVAILADHENTISGIIGSGTARIERGALFVDGVLSRSSPAAQQILALHQDGCTFQASVGVAVAKRKQTRSATINGQQLSSDQNFTLVTAGALREVSVVACGADDTSTVAIAATRKSPMHKRKPQVAQTVADEPTRDDDLGEAGDGIATNDTSDTNSAERIAAIHRISASYSADADEAASERIEQLEARAIRENWDLNTTGLEMLRAARPQARARTSVSGSGPNREGSNRTILASALMLHAGRSDLAVKSYGEHVAQRASELRCNSLVDLCASALRLEMRDVPRDRNEMIRAAFSTASLPIALSAYSEKSAAEAFNETPSPWRVLARRRTVNSFHEHKISRVMLVGNLQQLPPGGEIKHGSRSETVKSVTASTKALMLGIDRQHIINDDLGTFNDTTVALAQAAARTMNDDFANAILGNGGSFFSSANGNLGEAGSSLDAASLAAAIALMAKQTDAEGRIIDVRAKYLVVPPELEYTADQLLNSSDVTRDGSSDNQGTGNPLFKRLERITEPRLSSSAYTGYDADAWYLFAPPQAGAVNVALLGGKDTPTIEQDEAPFNTLGLQWRAYIDYGFALGEPVAAHKATGASS